MTSHVLEETLPSTPSVTPTNDPLPDQGYQPETITQRAQRLTGVAGRRIRGHAPKKRSLARTALGITREITAPALIEKAGMSHIPDSELQPIEIATRQIRNELMSQLHDPTPMERYMVDMIVTDIIVVETIDVYIKSLAQSEGIINRADKFIFPIVEQAFTLKSMLARRMKMLGVKRHGPKKVSVFEDTLNGWRSGKAGGTPPGGGATVPLNSDGTIVKRKRGRPRKHPLVGTQGKSEGPGVGVADTPTPI
jgi:hypothetical protein